MEEDGIPVNQSKKKKKKKKLLSSISSQNAIAKSKSYSRIKISTFLTLNWKSEPCSGGAGFGSLVTKDPIKRHSELYNLSWERGWISVLIGVNPEICSFSGDGANIN